MAKGNNYDNMRNVYFKSRTFVFVGILMLGFAAFSFWGLSTQNSDLLIKIEQLEDNVNIGSRKLRDLEDELAASSKKASELQKTKAKLEADLLKKENLINLQGGEAAQWRDKIRDAESEVQRLKLLVTDKTKELSTLQKQIATQSSELSLKDSLLQKAQEALSKLQSQIEPQNPQNSVSSSQLSNIFNLSSTSSQPGLVLAKPDDGKKIQERDEPVGAKPEEEELIVKPEEELELVAPDGNKNNNVLDQPDNDEAKFKEIQAEVEVADDPAEETAKKDGSKETINEPNLINSMGENLDDEPEPALVEGPVANPRFRNFNPRSNNDKKDEDNNLPEDQEVENEHDDDRGDN